MSAVIVKPDEVVRLLNMVYSVFLAILARFAIQQSGGTDSKPLEIHFLISGTNWLPVLFLSVYFFLDWLTTNITVPLKVRVTHILLPFMVIAILALGGLVAFAFAPSSRWVLLFGLYASIVPWYDIIGIGATDERALGLQNCMIIYGLIFCRVVTGIFILLIAVFKLWLHPDTPLQTSAGWLITWLGIYVGFKLLRYVIFLPLFHKQVPT